MIKQYVIVALLSVLTAEAIAVDGIAVSTSFTMQRCRAYRGWRGDIIRFDIENSKAVKLDTLYRGIAHCPCISPDGKYVSFFRDGDTWDRVNNKKIAGGNDYLSVMDIDGKNVRDLVTFSGDFATNPSYRNGEDRLMDWPVGGWIYYNHPHHSKVIWRVNVQDPSKNEKYHNYGGDGLIRRWNLSLDGTCASADQIHGGAPHTFPDKIVAGGSCGWGCNSSISCSGRFTAGWGWNPGKTETARIDSVHTSYRPGNCFISKHSLFDYKEWNRSSDKCTGSMSQTAETYVSLAHAAEWLGQDSIGRGCELIRWAVNSDKWNMYTMGWAGHAAQVPNEGANQLMYNWIDWEPIVTGKNPHNTSGDLSLSFCNTAGDFWVRPPKDEYIGTHYEDISGEWVPIGTWSTTPVKNVRNSWDLSGPKPVRKFDLGVNTRIAKTKCHDKANAIVTYCNSRFISVQFSSKIKAKVILLDLSGRKLYSSAVHSQTVRIPVKQAHGLYILHVNDMLLNSTILIKIKS